MISKSVFKKRLMMLLCAGIFSGCQNDLYDKKSAKDLYAEAYASWEKNQFKRALEAFEEVERQHPYSDHAGQALLMAGECALKSKQYSRGITSLDMFIRMHPTSDFIEKAFYLRALCYDENRGHMMNDLSNARNALQAFDGLLNRFPKGQYVKEAEKRRAHLARFLAEKDLKIAVFYKNQNNLSAALHHLSFVDKCGDDSGLGPKVLYETACCFHSLGMRLAAQRICDRMRSIYPKHTLTLEAVHRCKNKTDIANK